jgi:predicted nicotinamide N-methyase
MSARDVAAFIRQHTAIARPTLVPEIRLHLATEVTPLWTATEAWLEEVGLPPPFWAFSWPGGQALARYLLDRPEIARGRRVLDFGAGSGVGGIAAALSGGEVTLNDIDSFAGVALGMNAVLNQVAAAVEVRDLLGDPVGGWDVILVGDMAYEKPLADRMVPWLRRQVAAGALVLLGDPGRNYLHKDGLAPITEFVVPTSKDLEDREQRETTVWRLLG